MNKSSYLFLAFLLCSYASFAQNYQSQIDAFQQEIAELAEQQKSLQEKIEGVKLQRLQADLQKVGLPKVEEGESLIQHAAMSLVYDETHEQARWVAHIITPDIIQGQVARTNDFRVDPKIATGTAVEKDYFLKSLKADNTYEYDGFGYDRGHLAPSADFRWSQKALSESYYYSNMSPQLPDFNREKWGELESLLRGYIYANRTTQLYVVTGGQLEEGLPVIERGVNKVSIPKTFWKVALDLTNKKAIGFLMPNRALRYPLDHYAVPIDEIESLTGIDFFHSLEDAEEARLEASIDLPTWMPEIAAGDVAPLAFNTLPSKTYNTIMAKKLMNKDVKITVAGQVVSARYSRKGNVMINLDKKYPNEVFSVFIRKEHIINFPYDPVKDLQGKTIYVKGVVGAIGQTPTMFIKNDKVVKVK